jgi:type II secretory pathway pseudopilin PulG
MRRMRVTRRWAWHDSQAGFWALIELLIVAIIIVVAVSWYLTSARMVGAVSGGKPGDYKSTTVPGVALERAKGVECQNNLQQLRAAIATYQANYGAFPSSLEELQSNVPLKCPVGGEDYVYDSSTGQVHCVHRGHEHY